MNAPHPYAVAAMPDIFLVLAVTTMLTLLVGLTIVFTVGQSRGRWWNTDKQNPAGNRNVQTAPETKKPDPAELAIPAVVPQEPAVPPSVAGPLTLPDIGWQFEIQHKIGEGSCGSVYRAKAPGGVDVVVKIIRWLRERPLAARELRALDDIKNLRHPFLLTLHGYWTDGSVLYVVSELAECNLKERWEACGRSIPLKELFRYLMEVAEALDFLHANNIIHRDIKPENIFIAASHARLGDYGLAKELSMEDLDGTICGTSSYMAPETWRGESCPASDLYALCLCFTYLWSGRHLFPDGKGGAAMDAHLSQSPDLTAFPLAIRLVLRKALAKNPADRYTSCQQFVTDLIAASR